MPEPTAIEVVLAICTCKLAKPYHGQFRKKRFGVSGERFMVVEGRMAARDHFTSARKIKAWFCLDVHERIKKKDGSSRRRVILRLSDPRGHVPVFRRRGSKCKRSTFHWIETSLPSVDQITWRMAALMRPLNSRQRREWLGDKCPRHWRGVR